VVNKFSAYLEQIYKSVLIISIYGHLAGFPIAGNSHLIEA